MPSASMISAECTWAKISGLARFYQGRRAGRWLARITTFYGSSQESAQEALRRPRRAVTASAAAPCSRARGQASGHGGQDAGGVEGHVQVGGGAGPQLAVTIEHFGRHVAAVENQGIARVSSSRRRRLHTAKPEVPGSSTRSSTSAGARPARAREGPVRIGEHGGRQRAAARIVARWIASRGSASMMRRGRHRAAR